VKPFFMSTGGNSKLMMKMIDAEAAARKSAGLSDAPATVVNRPQTYPLYGLRVRSNMPLPLTPVADNIADLVVSFDGLIPCPDGPGPEAMVRDWGRYENRCVLRFRDARGRALEFIYDPAGTRLSVHQSYPEWQDDLMALMGVALAVALHLRGQPVLHAASLVKDGWAFLLLGSSSAGKSTLAAALAAEGLSFHSDDIAALDWDSGSPVVQAGYPRLKITAETAAALGWPADSLLPMTIAVPEYPKKWVDVSVLPGGFHESSAPLKKIYLLAGRKGDLEAPLLETLSPPHAAIAMVRHLYGRPWMGTPEKEAMEFCARIAETTVIRRLWLPDGMGRLRESARALITDMQAVSPCRGNAGET